MGEQIQQTSFSEADFANFGTKLREETALLAKWFESGALSSTGKSFGLELETWLLDANHLPCPENRRFLDSLNNDAVVPELSKFNAEINATPHPVASGKLHQMQKELEDLWAKIQTASKSLKMKMLMIGTLPTLRDPMLGIEYLTDEYRYHALNEQILRMRGGKPINFEIEGIESVKISHTDIMLESAATSMQVHFRVETEKCAKYMNASTIASAATVAISSNSPFLFGKSLWAETRIAIFEQAVNLPSFQNLKGEKVGRVCFGNGYIRQSMMEMFLENLDGYPILLPVCKEAPKEKLSHLRFHNGSIWRWNRPIVGFVPGESPHVRIEHRVPGAGPTVIDVVANVAFYLGLTHALVEKHKNLETMVDFSTAKNNFYDAAKFGLDSNVQWIDGKEWRLQTLIHDVCVPMAFDGLVDLGFSESEAQFYLLDVIRNRARTGRTGACWQRSYRNTHGADFQKMTEEYFNWQETGRPVHEWSV